MAPIGGECELIKVETFGDFPIYVRFVGNGLAVDFFSKEGRFCNNGEVLLFPSKHQRDWSKFVIPRAKDLPFGTVCICFCHNTKILLDKMLGYYAGNAEYSSFEDLSVSYKCDYIIPVDKFNFKELTFDNKDNYGTAYKEE